MDSSPPVAGRHLTLRQLGERVRKPVEPWASRFFYRKISLVFTYILLRTPVTPHVVSWFAAAFGVAGVALMGWPHASLLLRLLGVLGLQLAFLGDHVDGELARARGTFSVGGIYADEFALEVVVPVALAFGLPVVVYGQTGDIRWLMAGAAFTFLRCLNLVVYFLGLVISYRYPEQPSPESDAPPRSGPVQEAAKWYWVISKIIGAVSILFLLDVGLQVAGREPWIIRGLPVTLLSAYVVLGIPVYGLSTLLSSIEATRGRIGARGS